MVFVKKSNFLSSMSFGQIKPEKIVFLVYWIKKNAFRPEKGSFKKRQKKSTFSKGVSPWFLSKIELFIICVFLANQARKDRFCLLDKKRMSFKEDKGSFKN